MCAASTWWVNLLLWKPVDGRAMMLQAIWNFFREKDRKNASGRGRCGQRLTTVSLKDEMAEMQTTITETRNEITQTVSKTLEDQSATIQQIQRVQKDTNDDLAALYMLKVQKTKDGIPYVAGIGAGIEDTDGQPLSNILLLADRIAMINPESGNSTPLFVAQGNQLFMNDVFLKRLFAVSITSSGNPPAFSLTPDGRLTAKKCGYQWQCECELRDAQQRHD